MQVWKKLPSEILPKTSFADLRLERTGSHLVITCIPTYSDNTSVKIIFPRKSLVAFECSDDCFDAIRQDGGVQEPRPIIGNGVKHAYPFLEVDQSPWLKRRDEVPLSFPGVRHFKFTSQATVIDVLSLTAPTIEAARNEATSMV